MADMSAKGRSLKGVDNGNSKLDDDKVRYIMASDKTQWDLAHKFGVSQSLVSAIKTGLRWSHVS